MIEQVKVDVKVKVDVDVALFIKEYLQRNRLENENENESFFIKKKIKQAQETSSRVSSRNDSNFAIRSRPRYLFSCAGGGG